VLPRTVNNELFSGHNLSSLAGRFGSNKCS
jgi:hypothetical protein